jgi:uncharacterized protein YbaR (Trm112 family)
MNRLMFLCHVREDEGPVPKGLARSLAARGMKIVYRTISPWLASERPNGLLREEIQTGLMECCYGIVLLSKAFVARNWPSSELDDVVSRVVDGEERLIHVWHGLGGEDIVRFHPPLGLRPAISLEAGYDQAADAICGRILEDDFSRNDALRRTQLNPKALDLFACRECGNHAGLSLECLTAPPIGTSGVLVCIRCGRGYPIRNGLPQFLGEGAFNPDEPPPPNLQPPVDLDG